MKNTVCSWENCTEEGRYPAPLSSRHSTSRRKRWFCLEHIRKHNAEWDFFRDMPPEMIDAFRENALHGHRPTWKMGVDAVTMEEVLRAKVSGMFQQETPKEKPLLPPKEQQALEVLGLVMPVTMVEIKRRYKKLAKEYHPDVTGNCKIAEEKFKQVVEAYGMLEESRLFIL